MKAITINSTYSGRNSIMGELSITKTIRNVENALANTAQKLFEKSFITSFWNILSSPVE